MRILSQTIPSGANVHKNFLPVIRMLLGLVAMVYIFRSIYLLQISDPGIWKNTLQLTPVSALLLLFVLLLMSLNWGVEVLKWKILSSKLEQLSVVKLIKSVLFGISLGMITPKRTGEFAGRIMLLSPGYRFKGLLLNTAGSMSQLFVTLLMGTTGLLIMMKYFPEGTFLQNSGLKLNSDVILTTGIFWTISLPAILYFITHTGYRFNKNSKTASRFNNLLDTFSYLSVTDIFVLFSLSLFRYLIFASQFWILLIIAGLYVPIIDFFALVSVIYLLMALIPLSAIWELGVRGSVALFVFSLYFSESIAFQPAVIAASTGLWFINLALPALAGSIMAMGSDYSNQFQDA